MPDSKQKRPGPGRPRDDELAARRRADIVKHAIEEFARHGFAGADLDAIAASAGCSKGTLYNYFRSKGDLFSASVDHVMFSLVKAVGASDDGDPLEQVENLVRRFLRHFSDHPQFVELLIQERSDFRDREEPTYYTYRVANRRQWENRFQVLMEQGRMRRMPTEQAMNILSDLLYGTIFMNYFRRRQIKPEQQAEEILDVLLGGFLTEAAFADWQKQLRQIHDSVAD
jgi:AcrR family transcriptional regulator